MKRYNNKQQKETKNHQFSTQVEQEQDITNTT